MTFNPMMGYAVDKFRGLLPEAPSVIELGSQTLSIGIIDHPEITTVPELYRHYGFKSYDAIDFNGKGTILADLNTLLHPKKTYDLVTNNGTGEHIFNQAAVFHNCHDLCKAGGVMLHVLPWVNWNNHGFYNFHPVLFHDLAVHNDYEVVEILAGDRDGNWMEGFSITQQMDPEPIDRNVLVVAALKNAMIPISSIPYRPCTGMPRLIPRMRTSAKRARTATQVQGVIGGCSEMCKKTVFGAH